jgi:hypothetical protein
LFGEEVNQKTENGKQKTENEKQKAKSGIWLSAFLGGTPRHCLPLAATLTGLAELLA